MAGGQGHTGHRKVLGEHGGCMVFLYSCNSVASQGWPWSVHDQEFKKSLGITGKTCHLV